MRLRDPATGKPAGSSLAVALTLTGAASTRWRSARTASCWPLRAATTGAVAVPGTGKPVGSPINDYNQEAPQEIAFSPDCKLLAVSGQNSTEETVQLWNVATGRPVGAPFNGDAGGALAFSPDGKLLAITGSRGLQLWEVGATGSRSARP